MPLRQCHSCLAIFFAYQNELNIPEGERIPLLEVFRSKEEAFKHLDNYYFRKEQGFPVTGVREQMIELAKDLNQQPTSFEMPPPLLSR